MTSLTAMDGQLQDAQTFQPSLEHGADKSSKHNVLQEDRDSSQTMFQHNVIVMETLSTIVDLMQLPTFNADNNMQRNVCKNANQQKQIVQTAKHSLMQDAVTFQLMLEEHAEQQFFQLARRNVHRHRHRHQHQHQRHMFQQDLNQQAVIAMDGLFTNVDLTQSLLNNAETRL